MKSNSTQSWRRFKQSYREFPSIELALDLSRMDIPAAFFIKMAKPMQKAFAAMKALEGGAIANPDENRMVGHYWLRNPAKSPTRKIRAEIETTLKRIKQFAEAIHAGKVKGSGGKFKNILIIGIGGSALGPQFVSNALSNPGQDKVQAYFLA